MAQRLPRHSVFLRLAKIAKGPASVLVVARHNLRELPLTPNIDGTKQALNHVLQGARSADAVQADYEAALAMHGIGKLRKDAVRLIEAIISLPVGVDDPQHQYFEAALQWLGTEFGKANILSAVIHKDEAAQHMHVLIIPLLDGRMRGADLMGSPGVMRDRHARFAACMQQSWAQLEGVVQPHLRLPKADMAQQVITHLQRTADPMWKSSVVQVVRDCIERNPEPFYVTLGLGQRGAACTAKRQRPARMAKQRTMAQIFTRPVKGMRGGAVERYRQSEEYLRAHMVAPQRTLVPKVAQVVPKRPAPPARSIKALPTSWCIAALKFKKAAMPPKTRTLCSVGFVFMGAMEVVTVAPIQRRTAPFQLCSSKTWVALEAGGKKEDGVWLQSTMTKEIAGHVEPVPLRGKLLHWWLTKARYG